MKFLTLFFFLLTTVSSTFCYAEEPSIDTESVHVMEIEYSVSYGANQVVANDCSGSADHDEDPCSDDCHNHGHCGCLFLLTLNKNILDPVQKKQIFVKSRLKASSYNQSLFRPPIV